MNDTEPQWHGRWQSVHPMEAGSLVQARILLHWASQLVSVVGTTHLEQRPDFSHTNLGWNLEHDRLESRPVGGLGLRVGLDYERLALDIRDSEDRLRTSLSLAKKTLEGAQDELAALLGELDSSLHKALARPEHELPTHPVAAGGRFELPGPQSARALKRWFHDAQLALQALVEREEGAGELRCWPHHFDLASLISLDRSNDTEQAPSVGVGMSPGDDSYTEPYFYVTPWPYPAGLDLPDLPHGGAWHTGDWTGAVMTASGLLGDDVGAAPQRLGQFLQAGLDAAKRLLR